MRDCLLFLKVCVLQSGDTFYYFYVSIFFSQNYTLFLYNADKSTKVCAHALEAFCLLLEKYSSHVSVQDINLHQLIEGICIQTQRYKGSTGEGVENFVY